MSTVYFFHEWLVGKAVSIPGQVTKCLLVQKDWLVELLPLLHPHTLQHMLPEADTSLCPTVGPVLTDWKGEGAGLVCFDSHTLEMDSTCLNGGGSTYRTLTLA